MEKYVIRQEISGDGEKIWCAYQKIGKSEIYVRRTRTGIGTDGCEELLRAEVKQQSQVIKELEI